jgi:lipopolysaccharide export system permease protein
MFSMRILQRHVLNDLLRIFSLAVFVLTVLLVVMGVAGEAAKNGLGAEQIVKIIPYIIPSLLPYTIPATLLLTVCIVYGRMAGDNEITAIKAAGINVYSVLVPSFVLGAALSLGTFILTDQFIPWGRANIERVITLAMEDIFLDILRANSSYYDNPHGISIVVSRVDDRTLILPIFRYRLANGDVATITARQATVKFNLEKQQVELTLKDGHVETPSGDHVAFTEEQQPLPMPVATDNLKAPRNMTIENIRREQAALLRDREEATQQEVIQAVLALSEGAFHRLSPAEKLADDQKERLRAERFQKLRTEIHGRLALSCSCLFFVLIGSPFAIIQAKRQFLTNFALCFAPILLGYYPIVLLTMNLCREGNLEPAWGMWLGNVGLAITAFFVLRKVFRN